MKYFIFTLTGYISGSILYAYWLPKLIRHIDICELSDDGNPGTANAYIHGGFFIGTLALMLELAKGFIPVFFSVQCLDIRSLLFVPVMVAPVLGHAFPMHISVRNKHKKGGKAIATSFGVLLGIFPVILPVLFLALTYIVFSVVIVIQPHLFRSVFTFCIFSLLTFLFVPILSVALASMFISLIVIFKHLKAYHGESLSIRIF